MSFLGVHLVVINTKVGCVAGIQLVPQLRSRPPDLLILYLASLDRSTPAMEDKPPRDVPTLRQPFTAEELRALVAELLAGQPSHLDVGR